MDRPRLRLANLRLAFHCPERWDDMTGDDRVRACARCDRQVFNLSDMTRAEAEALLAQRGVTPCVRFYRRADGTVMTADCPTGAPREGRRLAMAASTLAAGTALATAAPAMADPAAPPAATAPADPAAAPDSPATPDRWAAPDPAPAPAPAKPPDATLDEPIEMGVPVEPEMGVIVIEESIRPKLEWSAWGRLGFGLASPPAPPSAVARGTIPATPGASSVWEAAAGADVSLGVAHRGGVRVGAWGELRTSSHPVMGAELVVGGLPPHPWGSRWADGIVLRAGGNADVFTAAFGFGYTGPVYAHDTAGVRIVTSLNQSIDDARAWSATLGLELDL